MSAQIIPLGTRFARLVVIGISIPRKTPSGYFEKRTECRCDCGAVLIVRNWCLRSGHTRSCGCLQRDPAHRVTHGKTGSSTYSSWAAMIQRCSNVKLSNFRDYGGRGISVCKRWELFDSFLSDMGLRPRGTSLERRDNSAGYNKRNCYWATRTQQNRNKRNNRIVTVRGITGCLAELVERFEVPYHRTFERIQRLQWPIEAAFFLPKGARRP